MKKFIDDYLLPLITILLTICALIIGLVLNGTSFFKFSLQFVFLIVVSFVFLIIKKLFKIKVNYILQALILFHIYGSMILGTCLEFYNLIPVWDLFMHGLFGFNMMFIFYDVYPKKDIILFSLSTMGFAAIWEIFEYLYDLIFKKDTQRVNESISLNKLPQADIMEDIMITLIGVVIFIIAYLIYKHIKNNKNKEKVD